ncbi:Cell cycle checkpoint protein rad17 [Arachnomyces sp. PD_36]|nr:Cell cycle checkpoint protein rad17 [Arachnomyces sp. PD_36]
MAAPPAKRQRRLVVLSSDDEESEGGKSSTKGTNSQLEYGQEPLISASHFSRPSSSKLPESSTLLPSRSKPKLQTTTKPQRPFGRSTSTSTQASPTPSPEKKRKALNKKGKKDEPGAPTKSLHSFFQPATEEQRWERRNVGAGSGPGSSARAVVDDIIEDGEGDDWIEDDFSDDDFLAMSQSFGGGSFGDRSVSSSTQGTVRGGKSTLGPKDTGVRKPVRSNTKKRFILPPSPVPEKKQPSLSKPVSAPEDLQPWAERFAPLGIDELAVHKRKITDVQRWLEDVFLGRNRRRLLVLRGPAGSGKTTTISLLSKVLGYDIIEWKNPLGSEYSAQGYTSMSSQFEEFLGRGDKFGSLDLGAPSTQGTETRTSTPAGRRIILLEEFPSTLSRTSTPLISFRSALMRYLAANVPSHGLTFQSTGKVRELNPPVVIIVSETLLSTTTAISDNFTAHRLLGPEISNHPGVNIIDFNSIAPTIMLKALNLVLKKEARCSTRKNAPGPAVLKRLSEMGDIRSAVSSLEFLCIRGDDGGVWGGKPTAKKKKASGEAPLTDMEKESLEMVSQREASLGIFHAVGKVMYNKREDPAIAHESRIRLPPPPDHLRHHSRPKISEVSIDDLINEIGTDTQTFISALHENYAPSCNGSSFSQSLEGCIEALSESDILGPDSSRGLRANRDGIGTARGSYQGYGAGVDMLRQDEMSFHVSVRGLLFSLPYPVNRRMAPSGGGNAAYKMFYPTSLRLWKQVEEVSGLLDTWMHRVTDPHSSIRPAMTHPDTVSEREGVGSWKSRRIDGSSNPAEGDADEPTISRAMVSRDDLLLERLPYLAKISTDQTVRKDLEKITQFVGIGGPSTDEEFDTPTEQGLQQSPQKVRRQWTKQKSSDTFGPKLPPSVEDGVEKMFLSDDDIED